MKNLTFILLVIPCPLFSQIVSGIYTANEIPTSRDDFEETCNGPLTVLMINLPPGDSVQVTGIDIEYDMHSSGGALISHQRSQIHCQTNNTTESAVIEGIPEVSGTEFYERNNVPIANGMYAGGTMLGFEMRAWRTSQGSGCNTTFVKVNLGTWMITVHYLTIPEYESVGIGTISPHQSALLDLTSDDKGLLLPRMTEAMRDAIPTPAAGLLLFCTDCGPASLYQYTGGGWQGLTGVILEDTDGDTKIIVEKTPDEDVIHFDMGGTEYVVMDGPRLEIKNSGFSVFVGEGAGINDDLSNNGNVFIGYQSGQSNTTGTSGTFTLLDQMGRIVLSEFMHEGQKTATIDLDQVIAGVYFINTIENGLVYTQRLMITR